MFDRLTIKMADQAMVSRPSTAFPGSMVTPQQLPQWQRRLQWIWNMG
jgi:hypothetical protein